MTINWEVIIWTCITLAVLMSVIAVSYTHLTLPTKA